MAAIEDLHAAWLGEQQKRDKTQVGSLEWRVAVIAEQTAHQMYEYALRHWARQDAVAGTTRNY